VRHAVRWRPEGRWQCTGCRAAFASEENAQQALFECPGVPLPHGMYKREHIVDPGWAKDPDAEIDALCDESSCPCMTHTCDCDVCEDKIQAPGLNVLRDNHEAGEGALSRFDKVG
jgi:hypothetical protein